MTEKLADDLLRGAKAIAKHIYGTDRPAFARRIFHLHAQRELPTFKVGNFICARKSELDERLAKRPSVKCSFENCAKTTRRPSLDGWHSLVGWGPGIPDGWYCPQHAAAIDAVEADIAEIHERRSRRPQ
jgi:hypothetical protein